MEDRNKGKICFSLIYSSRLHASVIKTFKIMQKKEFKMSELRINNTTEIITPCCGW